MPFPLVTTAAALGTAALRSVGSTGPALRADLTLPALTVRLAQGGRGIQRKAKAIKRRIKSVAVRTANKVGARVRKEARKEIQTVLNVTAKAVRARERARKATPNRPVYEVRWRRGRFEPETIRGRRFRPSRKPSRGGFVAGKLTITTYRKKQVFDVVKKGSRYWFANESGTGRRVFGSFLPRGSLRQLRKLRGRLPAIFKREFANAKRRGRPVR